MSEKEKLITGIRKQYEILSKFFLAYIDKRSRPI